MLRLLRADPVLFIGIALIPTLVADVLQRVVVPLGASAFVVVAVVVGLVGFFFVLPWAFLSLAFVTPAIVLEGLGPIAGIKRSFHLVDKARLRTLGLWLLMGIITSLLGIIF